MEFARRARCVPPGTVHGNYLPIAGDRRSGLVAFLRQVRRTTKVADRMTTRKTERILNLTICLLVSGRYLPKSRIREAVEGYHDLSDAAFERTFERDKDELRSLGVPIEVGSLILSSTMSRVTGSCRASSSCRRSTWTLRRRLWSASRPGSGSTPAWPSRRRARSQSYGLGASSRTLLSSGPWSRLFKPPNRPSNRCG